ncbi:hypothetical protein EXU85_22695 [Spirosoma sp. KCTC 42546]|nr:hypothetical protein EXU85_22695 [Spirosoma sp. KCTC 42546]
MMNSDLSQESYVSKKRSVDEEYLTVQYWREEFQRLRPAFDSLRDIANSIAHLTSEMTSADWLQCLKNIDSNRGGRKVTRDAVKAMNIVIEADPRKKRWLKIVQRHKLVIKPHKR